MYPFNETSKNWFWDINKMRIKVHSLFDEHSKLNDFTKNNNYHKFLRNEIINPFTAFQNEYDMKIKEYFNKYKELNKLIESNRQLKPLSSFEMENLNDFEKLQNEIESKQFLYQLFESNLIKDINESIQQCYEKLLKSNNENE